MKNPKKILLVALVLFVMLAAAPFSKLVGFELPDFSIDASAKAVPSRGSCGENVTYTYDVDTKKLVISGTGPMDCGNSTASSPFYDSDIKTVVIEEGVTSIDEYAFPYCESLVNVSVASSVKTIGSSAFQFCKSLKKIVIPEGVEKIHNYAFYDCSKLADMTLPDSLTYIGKTVFEDTQYYKQSSNKVDGVTYLGNYLIKADSSVSDCTVKDGTTLIAHSAFGSCSKLKKISIPDSVKYINDAAFGGCKKLEEITLPFGIERIESSTFYNCGNLRFISIPDSVKYIGKEAFRECPVLLDVTLPANLESIEEYTFYDSGLTRIYIPKTVKSIANFAFNDCDNLEEIYYEGSSEDWKAISKASYIFSYDSKVTINYNHVHEISGTLTPATETKDGVIKETCICGYLKKTTLNKIDSIKLKKADLYYTGDVLTPAVVIKDSAGNTLQENVDYTVTIPNEIKDIGKYDVNIDFINNYSGKKTLTLNVYAATEKITLNSKKVTVAINQYFTTEVKVTPATANQTVKYKTADKKIAAVSAKGLIKGVAAGKTTITVTSGDGKTAKITVEVCNVKLNTTSKTMNIGQTYTLKLSNSKFKVSKWSSSDSKIVKVDSKGLITAKAKGTATITAKLTNGIKLTCKVTVKKVSLSATKATIYQYEYKYLSLYNALGTPKWSSSNTKVATVNSSGKVVGVAAGTATITATYLGVKYNCTVTIKKQAAVTVTDVYISTNSADGVKPNIKICNNTYKDIKYMKIYTEYRNKFGDPARCSITGKYTETLKVESGLKARTIKWFYWDPVIYNGHVSRLDIKKIEITFVDNTKTTVTVNGKWYGSDYYY